MPLATYTAVLLSNSAVPVWFAARPTLPLLFGASSAASLVSVFDLMPLGDRERTIVRRFGIAGRVAGIGCQPRSGARCVRESKGGFCHYRMGCRGRSGKRRRY